jgi:hypothetical protein
MNVNLFELGIKHPDLVPEKRERLVVGESVVKSNLSEPSIVASEATSVVQTLIVSIFHIDVMHNRYCRSPAKRKSNNGIQHMLEPKPRNDTC